MSDIGEDPNLDRIDDTDAIENIAAAIFGYAITPGREEYELLNINDINLSKEFAKPFLNIPSGSRFIMRIIETLSIFFKGGRIAFTFVCVLMGLAVYFGTFYLLPPVKSFQVVVAHILGWLCVLWLMSLNSVNDRQNMTDYYT